jgi:amino acid transporter
MFMAWTMASVCGWILCLFIAALGFILIVWIWTGKIDLSQLLSEANGDASMSRFQLLIFTFVIAISLFMLVEKSSSVIPDIPNGVLTLLGISASTYAVGKGISYSQPSVMLGTPPPDGESAQSADDAQAAADEAGAHAAAAQQAAADIKAVVTQVAVHAATAQQAVAQTAENAAIAQQAADKAAGNQV